MRRGIVIGAVVLAAAVVASVVISNRRASERTVNRLEAGACSFDRRGDSDRGQGRNHVGTAPRYDVDPPAGGDHLGSAAQPGFYAEAAPDDGQLVHALEHGDVVLWHRPDAAPATLEALRDIANRYDDDVLVVPRESLVSEVSATAWQRRLLCPAFERAAIQLFVESYRDEGPESEPQGG